MGAKQCQKMRARESEGPYDSIVCAKSFTLFDMLAQFSEFFFS